MIKRDKTKYMGVIRPCATLNLETHKPIHLLTSNSRADPNKGIDSCSNRAPTFPLTIAGQSQRRQMTRPQYFMTIVCNYQTPMQPKASLPDVDR